MVALYHAMSTSQSALFITELVVKPSEKDELSLLADIPTCLDETTVGLTCLKNYPLLFQLKFHLNCCG